MQNLAEKIRKKQQEEFELVEKLTSENLSQLDKNLSKLVQKNISTITEDMEKMRKSVETKSRDLENQVQKISVTNGKLAWWVRKPLLTIVLSTTIVLGLTALANLTVMKYQANQTRFLTDQKVIAQGKLSKIKGMGGVKGTAQNQIWLHKQPKIFQAQEGFWVIEVQ